MAITEIAGAGSDVSLPIATFADGVARIVHVQDGRVLDRRDRAGYVVGLTPVYGEEDEVNCSAVLDALVKAGFLFESRPGR